MKFKLGTTQFTIGTVPPNFATLISEVEDQLCLFADCYDLYLEMGAEEKQKLSDSNYDTIVTDHPHELAEAVITLEKKVPAEEEEQKVNTPKGRNTRQQEDPNALLNTLMAVSVICPEFDMAKLLEEEQEKNSDDVVKRRQKKSNSNKQFKAMNFKKDKNFSKSANFGKQMRMNIPGK